MARFKFRRGEPVVHYSLVGPHIGYWGRKVGKLRVLANDPNSLDAGACISEADQGHTIFPAPNQHGVYDERHASQFMYRSTSGRDHAAAYVLHIGPNQWAYATEYTLVTGGFSGVSSPLTATDARQTEEEATVAALAELVGLLRRHLQYVLPSDASRYEKRRRIVRAAIIALMQQVSPALRDTIFMLVNR